MALVIQKYGGTSVGSAERIRAAASRIIETKKQGNDVVAIVSAMSGETDKLMTLAQQMSLDPDERELDLLLSESRIWNGFPVWLWPFMLAIPAGPSRLF